ncbi:hypothetical protein [Streptomyces cucumeris]|uniref:hypothetical protein n=1 Tax=Streptomyces cucumeris TaxID=2962890 RepID=UPI003D751989
MGKLHINLKTDGETRFRVAPGQTVVVDLGEIENTEPHALPIPALDIRRSTDVALKVNHTYTAPPDRAVLIQYEFTNEGEESERVVIRQLDVEVIQRA